uniref:Uncharacterized protein n=1 Tax=Arion vulgaris TaxID=1028688 RepID=A0A0B6Z0J7_9EUPU
MLLRSLNFHILDDVIEINNTVLFRLYKFKNKCAVHRKKSLTKGGLCGNYVQHSHHAQNVLGVCVP